jgi:hypothetical protein
MCGFATAQNANSLLLEKVNLQHTQLGKVHKYVISGQTDQAVYELLQYYRLKNNNYLKVSTDDILYLKNDFKEEVEKTIRTADEVLNHYFLFRYDWDMEKTNIPHQFENEINWTAIPNGDEEWCYMLNRHRFWIDLGKAYLLTGDEKYAKGFVNQVTHWIDENPLEERLKHLSWRRIEAGIRCENWIKTFEYVKESKHVTPEFLSKFLNSLYQHGEYINSSFSNFSKTSNWGVIEYHGLFSLAHFFDEFKIAPKWQENAIKKLTTCINLQVLSDGNHWEQSPMYHNEVFHCYLNVCFIAKNKKIELPEPVLEKTKAMAYANVKWQKPNFKQPLLGDSDDTDIRGLLTLAAYLFTDPILKSRAFTSFDYENVFLLGKKASKEYEVIVPQKPDFLSTYQKGAGDFYMRTSWNKDATYASLHLRKLGCGHGHDNLLHFTLFANGRDYLVDGGRYTYVNNEWREYFKSNKAHNTLGVDNLPNSIYQDSWTNKYEARSQGIYTVSEENFDYGEAENTAYKRLDDPVSLKRRILFLKKANVWLIFDSFSAKHTHTYSQYFNFPNNNVDLKDGRIETNYKNDNLRIQPIKNLEIKLSDEWWSQEYNLKTECKRAEFYKKATGFTSFLTALYFPQQVKLQYEKTPVYNRNNIALADKDVEAVTVTFGNKEYTLLVVHNSPAPAAHFYIVKNQMVSGEVVLIEKTGEVVKSYTIKN